MYSQLKTYSIKQLLFHIKNGEKLGEECQKELSRRESKQGVTVLKKGIVSNNNFQGVAVSNKKDKKDKKISDKLLSWVLGCDLKFKCEYSIGFCFNRTSKETKPIDNKNIEFRQVYTGYIDGKRAHTQEYYINLHTFIHLAKIKVCEYRYEVVNEATRVYIYSLDCNGQLRKMANKFYTTFYDIKKTIEALEWIAEKVGGEGVTTI